MGWGEKAIEIRSVETGHLDGVFMHKRAQRLKFLCERNDKVRPLSENAHSGGSTQFNKEEISMEQKCNKSTSYRVRKTGTINYLPTVSSTQVFFASVRQGGASQVYFMTLGRTSLMSW